MFIYYRDDNAVYVINHIGNPNTSNVLNNILLQFEHSHVLRVEVIKSTDVTGVAGGVTLSSIPCCGYITFALKITMTAFTPGDLGVKLSHTNTTDTTKNIAYKIPLSASDFLRVVPMDTQRFGEQWGSHSSIRSVGIKVSGSDNINDLISRIVNVRLY